MSDVIDLHMKIAEPLNAKAISEFVNSAFRGETSKKGWTTEADLLDGQRTDPKSLEVVLKDEKNSVLLFLLKNELLGCVLLQKRIDRAYLGMLTVKPERQDSGIGKVILKTAEDWVVTNWNTYKIEMTVIQKRIELIAWYERRGYKWTGARLPFPYSDIRCGLPKVKDLEFVVLEKTLDATEDTKSRQITSSFF